MKKEYYVEFDDIICRKAKESDNLDEIATLIYETDPYIYPYWFNNSVEEAISFLKPKFLLPGFVFNLQNAYVAVDKKTNEILGLVIAYNKDTDLDFDYTPYLSLGESYKTTINEYVLECIDYAKKHDVMYYMNTAVSKNARSMGVGKKLLGSVSDYFEKIGYTALKSECLIHNLPIMNLCHALGFKETDEVKGFNKFDDTPVDVVNVLRTNNNKEIKQVNNMTIRKMNSEDNKEEISEFMANNNSYIISSELNNTNDIYLAIDSNTNKIESIICFSYNEETIIEINSLYVSKEIDETYIETIFSLFLSKMDENGISEYILNCSLHNLPAKNLFHDLGFVETKEFVSDEKEQEIIEFKRRKDKILKEEFQESQNFKGIIK